MGQFVLLAGHGPKCPIRIGVHDSNRRVTFWADKHAALKQEFKNSLMPWTHRIGAHRFVTGMAGAALGCFVLAFFHWHSHEPVKFVCYVLAAAVLSSSLKVSLPSIEGTLSVNFLFTLLGILEMSLPETLLIGLAGNVGQFYWRPARRLKPVQLVFNLRK